MRHITLPRIPKPLLLLLVLGVPLVMLPFVKAATAIVELSVWLPWLVPASVSARGGKLGPTAFDFLPLALFGLVAAIVALSCIVGLRRKAPVQPRIPSRRGQDVRRLTDLRGMPVIDLSKAGRMGYVMDVIVDPKLGRLTALDLGTTGRTERISFTGQAQLRIGHQAIVFVAPTIPSQEPATDGVLKLSSLLGLYVFTETGARLGKIKNAYVDAKTLHIAAYVLRGRLFRRFIEGERLLDPSRVIASSPHLLLVCADGAPQNAGASSTQREAAVESRPMPVEVTGEAFESPPAFATVLADEEQAA